MCLQAPPDSLRLTDQGAAKAAFDAGKFDEAAALYDEALAALGFSASSVAARSIPDRWQVALLRQVCRTRTPAARTWLVGQRLSVLMSVLLLLLYRCLWLYRKLWW